MRSSLVLNNELKDELSPYLQKHSNDPINWQSWNDKTLEKAQKENKIIFLSIGYLACHWCNVMHKETFTDNSVAKILNNNFISIKVDREERPDLDKIYMESLHHMGLSGGWPLTIFLLPNQTPFYGGTYFTTNIFKQIITDISKAFIHHKSQLEESAFVFTDALKQSLNNKNISTDPLKINECVNDETNRLIFSKISQHIDKKNGGLLGAPKFPMPDFGLFLFEYYKIYKDQGSLENLSLVLDKMANGGIYDHLHGGFFRYSTDNSWDTPHFEKMLYDNGQLIKLYSKSYTLDQKEDYRKVIFNTINFIEKKLKSSEGGFYCSLDADSGDEEGSFYTWNREEIDKILGVDSDLFCNYFSISEEGNWINKKNILKKIKNINEHNFKEKINSNISKLNIHRNKRTHPKLDNKILASWNAILLTGLLEAYQVFKEPKFLNLALENASFLEKRMIKEDKISHVYNGQKAYINGFLEDYAWIIQAFFSLYKITLNEKWLINAQKLINKTITNFYDKKEGFFFFSDKETSKTIVNTKEIYDGSISSSNSIMAQNLILAGIIFNNNIYTSIANKMILLLKDKLLENPTYYLSWSQLFLMKSKPFLTLIIIGKDSKKWIKEINSKEYINIITLGSEEESTIPILKDKHPQNKEITVAHICAETFCQNPIYDLDILVKRLDNFEKKELGKY